MTAFFFDIPDVPPQHTVQQEQYHRILMEKARRLDEWNRLEKEEEARRAALPPSRQVSFRIPTVLLEQLDQHAKAKGFSRGHFLRHITSIHLYTQISTGA